ncbi:MAG: glycosyltransferase [Bacteroidales bacterium]|nr:glycosyltransferase [Bacteroidales bacterium]
MITYNHEDYIAQAIEGVLMQKTDFPIELVISEDCGTDRTREICIDYQQKYPDIIKLLLPEHNLGVSQNFMQTVRACKGRYIAMCEGDDYWTDFLKLQKQVDFMEANPDYGLVHTRFEIYYQAYSKFNTTVLCKKEGNIFKDLLFDNFIGTLTVLLRKELYEEAFSAGILDLFMMSDYPFWLYIAKRNKVGYIKDCTAVYRYLEESVSHNNDQLKQFSFFQSFLRVREYFAENTPFQKAILRDTQRRLFKRFFITDTNNKDIDRVILSALDKKYSNKIEYMLCSISAKSNTIKLIIHKVIKLLHRITK